MMAKLGGFDDLPSNAQSFLTNYRIRLETMSEAESTAVAVREVYSAYYSEMGGVGAAPEPQARNPTTEGSVVGFRGATHVRGRCYCVRNLYATIRATMLAKISSAGRDFRIIGLVEWRAADRPG